MKESLPSDSQNASPVSKEERGNAWKKKALIGLILITAVLVVAFLISPVRATIAHVWFYLTASEETKQLVIAGGNPGVPTKFKTFTPFGREEMVFGVEGLVIDYAERANVRIASVANPKTMTNELYMLKDTPVLLTEDLYTKTDIAISHDGSHIAYSAPAEKRLTGPFFSLRAEDWTVQVMNLATREITDIGLGHGAQFVGTGASLKLLYSTTEGLVLVDLDTSERVSNENVPAFSASHPIRVTSDGSKVLIFDPSLSTYRVYSINLESLELMPLATLPHQFAGAILTDTSVYWVKKGVEGTPSELWSLSLEEGATPHREYTFIDGFIVTRVIHP